MMNDGLKPASVNRHLAIMSGMFTKLIDAGEYHSHNPFREIKRLREAVTEMAFCPVKRLRGCYPCLMVMN